MFNGDFTVQDAEMNDPIALARLGVEARSILKSIQTEDAKLQSASHPTRSDLHYFRARFNYYRLSLLRLTVEEKSTLEPILASFLHRIVGFEGDMGSSDSSVTPFLTSVEKLPTSTVPGHTHRNPIANQPALQTSSATTNRSPRAVNEELISQLQLIKMALASEIDVHGRRTLSDGLERVIQSLRQS